MFLFSRCWLPPDCIGIPCSVMWNLPNQRSSHKVPTPRGGRHMAIVVTFLAGGALLPIWTSGTQQLLVLLAGALLPTSVYR